MLELIPMTEGDFASLRRDEIPAYAEDKIASGDWPRDTALALAAQAFDELLPQGRDTPDHHLWMLQDPAVATPVGQLWITIKPRGSQRIAYVYEVKIDPAHQRRGYGTQAFQALEAKGRALGLAGIGLHVFGHNTAARALYAKLGFEPTDLTLYKPIGASGDV